MTREFTERDISETPKERVRRERAEYTEKTRQAKAERDTYMNEPRKDAIVLLRHVADDPFSWRPILSLKGSTNGRSIAETIEGMKRTACATWRCALWWNAYAIEGADMRFLGTVGIPHEGDR